jgi:hypothetical protein
MKSCTKTAVVAVTLVTIGLIVPATAPAHKLPASYARYEASSVALNWFLSDPDGTNSWVDGCQRETWHQVSCDANEESTHTGTFSCSTYSCHETDTITTCWKRVWATVKFNGYRIGYSVGYPHCSTRTDTSYF